MCGIVGYIGNENAVSIVTQGLQDLSYRGYHAAGVVCLDFEGRVVLQKFLKERDSLPTDMLRRHLRDQCAILGIGHTRWPTHGGNTIANAHPHTDATETIYVVHNGTITNFDSLRQSLRNQGTTFSSETDTEVIAHLVAHAYQTTHNLEEAVAETVKKLEGAYAIAVIAKDCREKIVVARWGSPLVIGINSEGCTIASDEVVLMRHVNQVVEVQDGEVIVVTARGITGNANPMREIHSELQEISKGNFADYMEKEIAEQGLIVRRAFNFGGRIDRERGMPRLGGLTPYLHRLRDVERVIIVGCGTAYHAGLVLAQYLKKIAGISFVEVVYASEFVAENIVHEKTVVIAISQSGETYDTKIAVEEAKRKGILTVGIVNRVGSSIAKTTDCGVYCQAGVEVSVASTKVFMSQVTIGFLIALYIGRLRQVSVGRGNEYLEKLEKLPGIIEEIYEQTKPLLERVAKKIKNSNYIAFVGKGLLSCAASEGALKMKEITYIPSEGFPAGELKHGPLAVLSVKSTVVVLCDQECLESMLITAQEIAVIGCHMVIIVEKQNEARVKQMFPCAFVVTVPDCSLEVKVPAYVVPLQLLAYFVAKAKKISVDTPRNIAKSVTVA